MTERGQLWQDEELVRRLQDGERLAFDIIYRKYVSKLYLSAFSVLKDEDLSKDIVQEVLMQLWVRREESNIQTLQSYLLTAVRYKVMKAISRFSRTIYVEESEMELLCELSAPAHHVIENEINELLERGVAALPQKCREVYILSRKQYLSNKEIAERMGITNKTVENQMTIALRRLRVILGDFLIWICVILPFLR